MIWFLTLLLPRALLLMLESWLATISTLLEVIGIQVEPSSPERQLKLQHIDSVKKQNKTKQNHTHTNKQLKSPYKYDTTKQVKWETHIIWLSWALLRSVEMGLVDSDMVDRSVLPRRPVPNNPFSSPLKDGFLPLSLEFPSEKDNESRRSRGCKELVFVLGLPYQLTFDSAQSLTQSRHWCTIVQWF